MSPWRGLKISAYPPLSFDPALFESPVVFTSALLASLFSRKRPHNVDLSRAERVARKRDSSNAYGPSRCVIEHLLQRVPASLGSTGVLDPKLVRTRKCRDQQNYFPKRNCTRPGRPPATVRQTRDGRELTM